MEEVEIQSQGSKLFFEVCRGMDKRKRVEINVSIFVICQSFLLAVALQKKIIRSYTINLYNFWYIFGCFIYYESF